MVFAPNYTQIPNVILDELMPVLGFAELKIIYAICRKTFGWHKTRDKISLSQLEKQTGLDRKGVIRAVKSLVKKSIITKEVTGEKGEESTSYQLIIKEEFKQCLTGGIAPLGGSGMEPLGGSGTVPPTKESNINKEKKEEKEKAADAAHLSLLLVENIKKINPNFSDSTQTWEKTWITLLNKREKGHIEALIKWAFTDFWGGVIVSPRSLYTNLSKIEAQWQLSKIKAENPKKGGKNLQTDDMKFANEVYEKTRPRDDIRLGPDYIEFEAGMATKCFKYGEENFRDKCLIELQKRKVKI